MLTRRRFLLGAAAVAAGGAAVGIGLDRAAHAAAASRCRRFRSALSRPASRPPARLGGDTRPRLATATRSRRGSTGCCSSTSRATRRPAHARVLEAALRTLERTYRWGPSGLLFTAGWGPGYFERVARGSRSPIPHAQGLSDFELPAIDDYDLCLHLACDDERRLAAVEAALLHGAPLRGSGRSARHLERAALARDANRVHRRRPARRSTRTSAGSHPATPSPTSAPLFMGFKSSLRRNQASEDDVTIPSGPFAGGTTMQVSYMRLRLDSWYENLNERERVARMYAPQVTPEQVAHFTTDAEQRPRASSTRRSTATA